MKKVTHLLLAFGAIVSIAMSNTAFSRHLTIVNTADYKMSIVAYFKDGTTKNWYCPAHQDCRLNEFPYQVKTVEIKNYFNPNKYTYYPNRHTTVAHPFENQKLQCENRPHRIACFNVHSH